MGKIANNKIVNNLLPNCERKNSRFIDHRFMENKLNERSKMKIEINKIKRKAFFLGKVSFQICILSYLINVKNCLFYQKI